MKLLGITITEYLKSIVIKHPNKIAIIQSETDRKVTWSELDVLSSKFSSGLLNHGLKEGDSILLWMENSIEWAIAFFAAVKLGIICSGIYPQLESNEINYLIYKSKAKAVIFSDRTKGDAHKILLEAIKEKSPVDPTSARPAPLLIYAGLKNLPATIHFEHLLHSGSGKSITQYPSLVTPQDVAVVSYTSGTTRHPKGVMLTHLGLVNNSRGTASRMGFRASDTLCLPVSFAHCFGLVSGLLICVASGATLVLLKAFAPEPVMACIEKYACTALHGVPVIFQRILEHYCPTKYDISTLRTGIVAGAICSAPVLRGIVDILGMKEFVVAYGQTETSPGCTQTSFSDPLERKFSSIGRPLPFVEMCVLDPQTSKPCRPGQKGEICTRGPHVMKGYLDEPEQTAVLFDTEGWFHTRDLGFVDKEGYFHYDGRLSDIIIRCGENISPAEVEAVLLEHKQVVSAKIYGIPSEACGEEVAASIQLQPDSAVTVQDLQCFLQGRIAKFKIPRFIEFCTSFETVGSGKVNVRLLRERMMEKIGVSKGSVLENQTITNRAYGEA